MRTCMTKEPLLPHADYLCRQKLFVLFITCQSFYESVTYPKNIDLQVFIAHFDIITESFYETYVKTVVWVARLKREKLTDSE